MKKIAVLFLSLLFVFWGFSTASATSNLYDWAFNVDGTTHEAGVTGDAMPTTGSLDAEGLGTLTWTTDVAGSHSFIAFFDHEIDEAINSFSNEYGVAVSTDKAIQSWEIDEPGYTFGDIYEHVTGWNGDNYSGTIGLDNTNSVTITNPNDVSWAMGWNFTLGADESALIELILSDIVPISEFYLSHTDPETGEVGIDYSPETTIYFSSTLTIEGGIPPIPEPATMILMGTGLIGLVGLVGLKRKKFRKK